MNSLLVLPEEETAPGRYVLTGSRAAYVFERHELSAGLTIALVAYRGKRGRGTVVSCAPGRIEIEALLTGDPPARAGVHLIVAVPRPQTIKKIIQLGCLSGLDSISFLNGPNVVKSYLQSKSLEDGQILGEVVKGLEQANDSVPPEIRVVRHAPKLFDELSERRRSSRAFLADTRDGNARPLRDLAPIARDAEIHLAVGPESGWHQSEVERFLELGFESVTLGERILRVETAASFLVAQIAALRA